MAVRVILETIAGAIQILHDAKTSVIFVWREQLELHSLFVRGGQNVS